MKNYISLLLLAVTIYSCSDNKLKIQHDQEKCTIILNQINENKRYYFKSGISAKSEIDCEIIWVSYEDLLESYCLDSTKINDTLEILLKKGQRSLQIAHKIKGLDYFFYHLTSGDTLRLNYDKFGLPNVDSGRDLDVQNFFRDSYYYYGYGEIDPEIYLRNSHSTRIFQDWEEIKKIKELQRLRKDYINLDSIFMLTEKAFEDKIIITTNLELPYQHILKDIVSKMRLYTEISSPDVFTYSNNDKSDYLNQAFDQNKVSDRLYFKSFFNKYIRNIDSTFNNISDTIPRSLNRYFSQLKLEIEIEREYLGNWEEAFQAYFSEFNKKSDTVFIQNLKYKHGYSTVTKNLLLKDLYGNELTLNELIDTSHIIWYIDFWASWCAPCRKEFPFSKNLEKDLNDLPIGFIYLAFNDVETNWKKAVESEKLAHSNNFLVINSRTSQFVKDIKLTSLPRYIIMDSSAQIIISNATRPSDQKTIIQLQNLLKNNY